MRCGGLTGRVPARPEALIVLAALVLTAYFYLARLQTIGVETPLGWTAIAGSQASPLAHFLAAAVLLGLVPLAAACWGCGFRLSALGLGAGIWREGLLWVAVGIPVTILAARFATPSPGMLAVYPLDKSLTRETGPFALYALLEGLYYVPWEILFRGVLLFGLKDRLGVGGAIGVQAALSAAAHFGSPIGETFAALPAGLLLGWLALRLGSMWYLAAVHWCLGVSVDWFALAARP